MKRTTPPSNEGQPLDKISCPLQKHVEFIRSNKTELVDVMYDLNLILNKVHEWRLITFNEYENLNSSLKEDREKKVVLLNLLMKKGDETCESFVFRLRNDKDTMETFPRLKEVNWNQLDTPSGSRSRPLSELTQNQWVAPSGSKRGSERRRSPRATGVSVPDQNRGQKAGLDLDGYVVSVSELRRKNKQYFQVKFQERHQTRQVTVFLCNQRDLFLSAMMTKSPVRLLNVKTFEEGENIRFNERSKLQILPEDLPFPFGPSHEVKCVTLAELQTNKENYQNKRVTVPQLEVLWRLRVGHRLNRDQIYRQFTEYLVADNTASSSLTVWEPKTLADQTCYCISNLTLLPLSELTLQTTADSVLTPIERPWSSVAPPADVSPPEVFTGEMHGVNLNDEKLICLMGHLLEKRRRATAYLCKSCAMTYKPRALRRVFTGRLRVKGIESFLQLEDRHVRELLGDAVVDDPENTPAKLKKALMRIDTVSVTVCGQHVLSVRASNGL